jgi:ABC-type lipoprotein release transport system permease subunit
MSVVLTISLRNLIRQKRRSILLGTAIAFGTMVLVLASAFSHGISNVLFDKIISYVSGHVSVNFTQNGDATKQIFHDGPRMMKIVKQEIPDLVSIQEAIGIMCRAIGNGKSDNVIMVGVDLKAGENMDEKSKKEAEQNFHMLSGRFEDLEDSTIYNPVLISESKATYLKVKKGDVLRVRYRTVYGQDQAEKLTVAGVFRPANMFMQAPIFLEIHVLKRLAGYKPTDIGQVYINIKNPKKSAIQYADRLQKALSPSLAEISGFIKNGNLQNSVTVLGFKTDSLSRALFEKNIVTLDGKIPGKKDILISDSLAKILGLDTGKYCSVVYKQKYGQESAVASFKISSVFKTPSVIPSNVMLVNETDFYKQYYFAWPSSINDSHSAFIPPKENQIYSAFSQEWTLLKRVKSTEELTKLTREIGQKRLRGTTINVNSMYESASAVLKLEYALNMITFVAVMVLFFIILIGVVNTLRMTVRERTREIGTIRAIGMQKKDVRHAFVMETFFLALFSSITGTFLAFCAMFGLSKIKFNLQDNPLGMLLVDNHLNFSPSAVSIIGFVLLIICIAVITSFFPARKAANLSAAEALRHFE